MAKLSSIFIVLTIIGCGSNNEMSPYAGAQSLKDTKWTLLGARCVTGDKATPNDKVKYKKTIAFSKDSFELNYQLESCGDFSVSGNYKHSSKGVVFMPRNHKGMNKATEACGLKAPHKMELAEPSSYQIHRHEMFMSFAPNKNREICPDGTFEEFYELNGIKFDTSMETCVGLNYDIRGVLTQRLGPTYEFTFGSKTYSSGFDHVKTPGNNVEFSDEVLISQWSKSDTGTPIKRVQRTLTLRGGSSPVWTGKVLCTVKHSL